MIASYGADETVNHRLVPSASAPTCGNSMRIYCPAVHWSGWLGTNRNAQISSMSFSFSLRVRVMGLRIILQSLSGYDLLSMFIILHAHATPRLGRPGRYVPDWP